MTSSEKIIKTVSLTGYELRDIMLKQAGLTYYDLISEHSVDTSILVGGHKLENMTSPITLKMEMTTRDKKETLPR